MSNWPYHRCDIDGLRDVLAAADERMELEPDNLQMEEWSCRTAGCLIGTFCQRRRDRLVLKRSKNEDEALGGVQIPKFGTLVGNDAVMARFSLPVRLSGFLFLSHSRFMRFAAYFSGNASRLSGPAAVARLRSTIRYLEDSKRRWANHEWLMSLPKRERRKEMGLVTTHAD